MEEQFMKWRPDFNLGIAEIDEQHKKIVELINILNKAFMEGSAREKLGDILDEMARYADYHFHTEEELFSKHLFPFSEEHKKLHDNFRTKVSQFREQFEKGLPITFRLLGFLRKWLTNHILDVDREYVDFVRPEKK